MDWHKEGYNVDESDFNNKPIKPKTMEIKTSKIKTVVSSKPFTNSFGTTIYHSLEMENGDKINIGKKTEQKVGWELTYEITDSGQEYNKAKSAQKVEAPVSNNGGGFPTPKNEGVQRMIVAQSSISSAVAFLREQGLVEDSDVLALADKFFAFVIKKGGENGN